MKSSRGVKIDYSFVNLILDYFSHESEELFNQIIKHTVAERILANAQLFSSDSIDIDDFWKKILDKEKDRGDDYLSEVQSCISYIKENADTLYSFIDELDNYLPDDFAFKCSLYLHLGYDIGIVAEGDALLNVGHPIFHRNKRELFYFALHELHHVGYTNYHETVGPLSEIQTKEDFSRLLERLTHLEGTATYSVKEIREREKQPLFFDYEVLNDRDKLKQSVKEYFEIYDRFRSTKNVLIEKDDFNVLEVMSGKNKRLWYVVGAHMAEEIDKKFGREELNQTIIEGAESFFDKFFECKEHSS